MREVGKGEPVESDVVFGGGDGARGVEGGSGAEEVEAELACAAVALLYDAEEATGGAVATELFAPFAGKGLRGGFAPFDMAPGKIDVAAGDVAADKEAVAGEADAADDDFDGMGHGFVRSLVSLASRMPGIQGRVTRR